MTKENDFNLFLKENPKYIGFIIKIFRLKERLPLSSEEEIITLATNCLWKSWCLFKRDNGKYKVGSYFNYAMKRLLKTDYKELAFKGSVSVSEETEIELTEVEDKEFINKVMELLSEQERDVIKLRFFESKTLKECGQLLNCSHEWVRKIEQRALDRVRNHCYATNR